MEAKYFGVLYRDINEIDRFEIVEYDENKKILADSFWFTDLCMLKNDKNKEVVKQFVEQLVKEFPFDYKREIKIQRYGLQIFCENAKRDKKYPVFENYITKYKAAIIEEIAELLEENPENGHWNEEEGIVFADKILERTGFELNQEMLSFISDNEAKAHLHYQFLNDYRERTNQEFNNILMSWRGLSLSQAALYMLLNKGYLFVSDIQQDLEKICKEFEAYKFDHFAQELRDCFQTKLSPKRNLIVLGQNNMDELKQIKTAKELEVFIEQNPDSDEEMKKLAGFLRKYLEQAHCKDLCKDVFELGISSSAFLCVRRAHVRDLGDIAYMTAEQAANIREVNEKIFEELRSVLEKYGLTFSKYE